MNSERSFCATFSFPPYGDDENAKENQLWMAYCLGNQLEMVVESIEAYLLTNYFWGHDDNTREE